MGTKINIKNSKLNYTRIVYVTLEGTTSTENGKYANVVIYPETTQKAGTNFIVKLTGTDSVLKDNKIVIYTNKNDGKENYGEIIVNGDSKTITATTAVENIYVERASSGVIGNGTLKLEVKFVNNPA